MGFLINSIGSFLFLVYIYLLSIYLTDSHYITYRYWFNSCALFCQLFTFGFDVYILKNANKVSDKCEVPISIFKKYLFLIIICCFSYIFFIDDIYYKFSLTFILLWSLSNLMLSFMKLVYVPHVPLFFNSVLLRIFRLLSLLPLIIYICFFDNVDISNLKIIFVLTLFSQFFYFIILFSFVFFKTNSFKFIASKTYFKNIIQTFLTASCMIILLRSDVIFASFCNNVIHYDKIDFAFITMSFLHIFHQIRTRNLEFDSNYKNTFSAQRFSKSYFNLSIFLLFVLFLFYIFSNYINSSDLLPYIYCLTGYLFFFSTGPTLELQNLKSFSLLPFLLLLTSILITSIIILFVNEYVVSIAISFNFFIFRFIHFLVFPEYYFKMNIFISLIAYVSFVFFINV